MPVVLWRRMSVGDGPRRGRDWEEGEVSVEGCAWLVYRPTRGYRGLFGVMAFLGCGHGQRRDEKACERKKVS